MKKGYWVVAYRSISDASAVKAYGALAVAAVQSFGGRFLTMSASQMQAHEAGLQQPTVLVEFDSYDFARSAHESEAYEKALQALGSGAERDVRADQSVAAERGRRLAVVGGMALREGGPGVTTFARI
jgi:uncharacterized protein (DUF1330 family)